MSLPWKNLRQQLTETVGIEGFEIEIPRYNSLLVDEQLEFDKLDRQDAEHQLSSLKFVQAIATDLEANYKGGDPKSAEDFANEAFAIVDSIRVGDGKNSTAIVKYAGELGRIMDAKINPTRQIIDAAEFIIKSRVDKKFAWGLSCEIPFKFYEAVYQFAIKEKYGWPKPVTDESAEQPTEGKSPTT
jgi:hypothetical protein